ncbi:MAG: DUF3800 domain-containing protein [Candidatus Aenigmarchaeota archaeon]|nr:DUF3800 domain-containing protein [Candidatus Aenigmarchaeota archaeon]
MYKLFLDESGDHNLEVIDPNHPVFALVGCIFENNYYESTAIKKVNELKIKYFNSTEVILHSRDIRKQESKPFLVLRKKEVRENFYQDLNKLFEELYLTILASVIDKHKLKEQYGHHSDNPYYLSLGFIMERYAIFLREKGDTGLMIIESRNKTDNELLYIAYSKIMLQGTGFMRADEFQKRIKDLVFVPKKENEIGTQLADLAAYPIATHILPNRDKRAFEILKMKFRKSKEGEIYGYGLKIFP